VRQNHSDLKGHRSLLLWFTGMSGAGKSSIANRVQANLHDNRLHTCILACWTATNFAEACPLTWVSLTLIARKIFGVRPRSAN